MIPDGKSILMTVYLSAITPACATVTSMAQLTDRDASPFQRDHHVLSTLLSILTMPLMIGSFERAVALEIRKSRPAPQQGSLYNFKWVSL